MNEDHLTDNIVDELNKIKDSVLSSSTSTTTTTILPSSTSNVDETSETTFNNVDIYKQFDQLASRTKQQANVQNNNIEQIQMNRRMKKISTRRDRIKSFIEFDDDVDLDLDSDGELDPDQRRTTRRYSTAASDYRNDLINVFTDTQQFHRANHQPNDDDNNNNGLIHHRHQQKNVNIDNDDNIENHGHQEEWSDFQTSTDCMLKANDESTQSDHGANTEADNNCVNQPDDVVDVDHSEDDVSDTESNMLYGRLNKMQQEQEFLNNSLIALTSHFAQVQLRLRQIVEAKDVDVEKREMLLAELETFANRGIPELMLATGNPIVGNNLERSVSMATSLMADDVFDDDDDVAVVGGETDGAVDDKHLSDCRKGGDCNSEMDYENIPKNSCSKTNRSSWSSQFGDGDNHNRMNHGSTSTMLITEEKLERQRNRQKELITQLKDQLEDLERYAYETGELNSLPSSMLLERQNAIIEQLKSKLPVLSIDEIDQLTPDELRRKVDHAVKELVNPVIMKEQLVSQLKTQVTDLERFIEFLQQGGGKLKKYKQFSNSTGSAQSGYNFMKFLQKKSSNDFMKNYQQFYEHQQQTNGELKNDEQTIHNQSSQSKRNNFNNQKISKCPQNSSLTSKNVAGSNRQFSSNKTTTTTTTNNSHATANNIFKRILSLLHVFAWTQLGTCASFARYNEQTARFEQNILKRTQTSCGRHWGDLRAHLEMAIITILDFYKENNLIKNPKIQKQTTTTTTTATTTATSMAQTIQPKTQQQTNNDDTIDVNDDDDDDDNDNQDFIALGNTTLVIDNYFIYEQITIMVRKRLSVALRNLIQHGLIGLGWLQSKDDVGSTSNALSTTTPATNTAVGHFLNLGLGCFSTRNTAGHQIITGNRRPMHAWELIVYYYEIKNGSKFRSTPTRRLSQSFGLQVVSGMQTNPKHGLLAAVDDIIDSHTRLKRSLDSHFKAFVSVALNQQMLSQWLRLILRNPTIVQDCYEKWSYTASTGFEDALRQLDKLSTLRFCLPTDIAVRQLQSIHDAF